MARKGISAACIETLEPRMLLSGWGSVSALFEAATPLDVPAGQAVAVDGQVDPLGTPQAYEFTAPATGSARIDMAAAGEGLDAYLEVYSARGRRLAGNDDASAWTLDSSAQLPVKAGQKYYVLASSYGGTGGAYSLSVTSLPRDDYGNDPDHSQPLIFRRDGTACILGTINYAGDADVLAAKANVTGKLTVTVSGNGRGGLPACRGSSRGGGLGARRLGWSGCRLVRLLVGHGESRIVLPARRRGFVRSGPLPGVAASDRVDYPPHVRRDFSVQGDQTHRAAGRLFRTVQEVDQLGGRRQRGRRPFDRHAVQTAVDRQPQAPAVSERQLVSRGVGLSTGYRGQPVAQHADQRRLEVRACGMPKLDLLGRGGFLGARRGRGARELLIDDGRLMIGRCGALHAACCLLPAARRLLPAARCLLPAACCPLPAACCRLVASYSPRDLGLDLRRGHHQDLGGPPVRHHADARVAAVLLLEPCRHRLNVAWRTPVHSKHGLRNR